MTKLKATLIKDEKDALELFSKLNFGRDVANFLEIPYGQLLYLLYKQPEKKLIITDLGEEALFTRQSVSSMGIVELGQFNY
ncbi:MAG: hypothetical protein U9O82_02915 [Thermodesulfobacteriota bacterium]|nr:hypothetical protein [Thermodesulfobacteriota bacterium]